MKRDGNLTITEENVGDFKALTSVGEGLFIRADASLPALTSVGGWLDIGAAASLPALTSVGGGLHISADASLPALTSVRGYPVATGDLAQFRLRAVAIMALATPTALDMSKWHTCATSHCIAGWGITLAGDEGRELESEIGPAAAGAVLLGIEAAKLFHKSDAVARAALRKVLEEA